MKKTACTPENSGALIKRAVKKNSKYLVGLVFLSVITAGISVINPVFYKKIIDDAIPNKDVKTMIIAVALMAALPIVNVGISMIRQRCVFKFSDNCERELRTIYFGKILRMNYPAFMRIGPVKLMSIITRSVGQIASLFLSTKVITGVSCIFQLLLIFGILCSFNKIVAIVTFIVVPIIYASIKIFQDKIGALQKEFLTILNSGEKLLLQVFNGMKTVRSYSGQEKEQKDFRGWLDKVSKNKWDIDKFNITIRNFIPVAASQVVVGCIFIFCANSVIKDTMSMGALVAIIAYVPILVNNIQSVLNIKVGKASVSKIMDDLDSILSEKDEYNSEDKKEVFPDGSLNFKDVDFTYGRENFDLKIENLEIEKGDFITIVGTTGGGKSSIMDIINKYYPISSGSVTLGGKSVDDISSDTLRSHISTMFQDVYMFNGTIAENISYPEKPDMDRINKVMEKAQLTEFVNKLPNKAEEIVETGGENFSGGECQRIALARMLYKNSDIYLLDEPTAALDAGTSKAIFDMLANENKTGKTVIAITHDAGKATYGNKVLVVNNGRIVEFGTPEELLEKNGAFASLYSAQQKMA